MARPRILILAGCGIALLAGLAVLALPERAMVLALLSAIGAGVAMATVLTHRDVLESPVPESSGDAPAAGQDSEPELRAELERHKQLERQLLEAKQQAEAATMAKGEFLATMSHEIRTPLNGVIPLLDLVLSTDLTPDQRDYLSTAFDSAKELLRIVDGILDYSKLDAQKLELENVGINLRELTTGVLRLMEKSAESKGLRLGLSIDPSVRLAVRGDPVRLRQVLTNLVSNAIKFTDRGGVSVHVKRIGETRTRNQLRFEVRDTGIGIAPGAVENLFQAFSQADASTTRTFGGTGLGLAICKRIITLMGGKIGVNSVPGKGSIFWFEVALDKALGDIEGHSPAQSGKLHVLLVTNNTDWQRRFSTVLNSWGMSFAHASNTQEALTRLRRVSQGPGQRYFDLVLVDVESIPTTVLALHRTLQRETRADQTLRVFLRGPSAVPAELTGASDIHVFPREGDPGKLRARILELWDALPSGEDDDAPPAQAAASPVPASPAPVETIVVPKKTASTGVPEPTPAPEPVARAAPGARALLVEDNPVNRHVAQRLLGLAGIAFDSAENGKEALEKMNAGNYGIVLMDCQMPVMDGYTATRKRREYEQEQKLPRVPIVAMTANAMLGDREKCLDAGMDDYMSKPLNRALLESMVFRWMGKPEPEPLPVAAPPPPVAAPAVAAPAAPVAAPSSAGPALDQEVLAELREVMGAEFVSLVRVFLEDAPLAIQRIRELAELGDCDAIAAPSHTLKSTSANLGAMTLSNQARHMEQDARQGKLTAAPARAAALAAEFDRVAAALRQEIS